ncbi:hypothetical protein BU17DRAFT_74925 [Hysterangium stoloniferum]|nr:hypothetical protein BU17DRAFT_74925 [Hysterangium stoloniferum]
MYSLVSVKNRATEVAVIGEEALTSKTYIYPLLGVAYFLSHPSLYPPLASRIIQCMLLTAVVTSTMFFVTYIPQAAVLTLVNGPFGSISAIALVLSESTTITTFIAKAFLLDGALTDLFDATLVSKGLEALVSRGREIKPGPDRQGVEKLGKALIQPMQRFAPSLLIDYILFLPLNFIPMVGTIAFLIAQGRKAGPAFHGRYYQLKGYNATQKQAEIERRRGGYIGFGTTAVALNLIPLASIFFIFTSTVGAALWAADLEKGTERHPMEHIESIRHTEK